MSKMSDLLIEIEDCYESGLSAVETSRRLGVSLGIVSNAYRDLQDEFYMDQENRSYINEQVSRYSQRAEVGHDWD
jgi:predicted transcriptional regulator